MVLAANQRESVDDHLERSKMIDLRTEGFEEALALLDIDIPDQLGMQIEQIVQMGAQVAASITPEDTGAMKRAWKWELKGLEGAVLIDPSATNPRSGALVASYAPIIEKRENILGLVVERIQPMSGVDIKFAIKFA